MVEITYIRERLIYTARHDSGSATEEPAVDILSALKGEDSRGSVPLGWDIVVYRMQGECPGA